ncbi:hypothetical protein M3Y96_00582900 [Aphelenchoides besseyi]|nr:hypothetical protein M3Y96_00582900 [Aphelenchoides besseyi]
MDLSDKRMTLMLVLLMIVGTSFVQGGFFDHLADHMFFGHSHHAHHYGGYYGGQAYEILTNIICYFSYGGCCYGYSYPSYPSYGFGGFGYNTPYFYGK